MKISRKRRKVSGLLSSQPPSKKEKEPGQLGLAQLWSVHNPNQNLRLNCPGLAPALFGTAGYPNKMHEINYINE